jgi:hypothetical protein
MVNVIVYGMDLDSGYFYWVEPVSAAAVFWAKTSFLDGHSGGLSDHPVARTGHAKWQANAASDALKIGV